MIVLTFFNWFFEILKWQNLVSIIKKISFAEASKQSLAALTASLFTPNRIGDYAAKAIYFDKPLRKRILLLNLLSNMAQMSTTILFGCIGAIIFMNTYGLDISRIKVMRLLTIIVIVSFLSIFGIKQFKIRGFEIKKITDFIKNISFEHHIKNILFSLIRYLIFSFQFYFLLQIFGVDVYYFNAMIVITTMYLMSSVIPTLFIFDVIVKGSIALYLFDIVGVNNLTILSIITLMWLLNFVLPSIFGSFYVLKFNTYKTIER